ncbi:expressed unknown protein [Seminavis robusta]|uniref:Uncharacterized protein n=1 Tax=Seminavis robusta TaxID=568900 RepID=A0A9N8EJN1_9STRA|nr:expressed unknown protein [Seminavis robusta]|eukprot:Sro1094_g240520.1 n/a (113) ;mRNA; f:13137-13475
MMRVVECLLFALLLSVVATDAFSIRQPASLLQSQGSVGYQHHDPPLTTLFLADDKRDASRSGTKRDRLDRLAELEDSRVETDKGFVVQAAGAFVAIIVLGVVAAIAISGGPI